MNKNLLAALIIAVVTVLWFVLGMPRYQEFSAARTTLKARNALIQDLKTAQENLLRLQREYNEYQALISKTIIAVPQQKQLDYLTASFQTAAEASGVQLVSLTFDNVQKAKTDYVSIPLRMELHGTYGALRQFLSELEKSLRLYDITKMEIAGAEGTAGGSNLLTITLQLTAYSLH